MSISVPVRSLLKWASGGMILALWLGTPRLVHAVDRVMLQNGEQLEGQITYGSKIGFFIQPGTGGKRYCLWNEVKDITWDEIGLRHEDVPPAATDATSSSAPTVADHHSQPIVDRILLEVATLRELTPQQNVPHTVVDKSQVKTFLQSRLAEEYPNQRLGHLEKALRKFGLLPAQVKLQQFYEEFYASQISGYYDWRSHRMYLADWIPLEMQGEVLVHELVHALQDQHYDLRSFLATVRDDSEQLTARTALIEGDALALAYDYVLREHGQSFTSVGNLAALAELQVDALRKTNPALATAPTFLVESALFPYLYGLDFLRAIRIRHPWRWLDRVYADPPRSTEQIMHPAKYLDQRDHPISIDLSPAAHPLSATWTYLDTDHVGEFGIKAIVRQFLDGPTAALASEGWGGDRYLLYERPPGVTAVMWESAWDSVRDAEEFAVAYAQVVAKKYIGLQKQPAASRISATLWSTEEGMVAIERRQATVLILEGFSAEETASIATSLWSSVVLPEADAHPVTTSHTGPLSAQVFYQRGEAALTRYLNSQDAGSLLEAKTNYEKALELDPDFALAHARLADIQKLRSYLQGSEYDSAGVRKALPMAERALALAPESGQVHRTLAGIYNALHEYEKAEAHVRQALQYDPDNVKSHTLLAETYRRKSQYDEALATLQDALRIPTTDMWARPEVYSAMASIYLHDLHQPTQAIEWYRKFLELRSESPWAWDAYAQALLVAGQFEEAERAAKKALSLGEFGMAHRRLGAIYVRQQRLNEAEHEFGAGRDGDGLVQVAKAFSQQGKTDDALRVVRQALVIDPDNAAAAHLLGVYAVEHEDWSVARQAFRQATDADNASAASFFGLGYTAERTGNEEQAVKFYKQALQLEPHHRKAVFNLSALLFRQGRYVEAIPYLRTCLEVAPQDAWANYGLGFCLRRTDHFQEAAVYLRRYLELDPHNEAAPQVRSWLDRHNL